MMQHWVRFAILVLGSSLAAAQSVDGVWQATIPTNGVNIPFRLGLYGEGSTAKGWFFNGEDRVVSTGGSLQDGKLVLRFDQYAAILQATVQKNAVDGTYTRGGKEPMPFHAIPFKPAAIFAAGVPRIDGVWELPVKSPKGESAWRFIVRQEGAEVAATILRVDGDTGTLTGSYADGKFTLSHFSGARPSLLVVTPQPDGALQIAQNGTTALLAVRVADARAKGLPLPSDPFHFTTVRDPAEPFHFSSPDLTGKTISNTDARFRGKVVIVAISGSWCPNCHDEAPYLEALYKRYRDRGLEVVSLSFEEDDQLKDPTRLRAFIKQYGIDYTVLLGGEPSELHDKLPQAVNLNSWPTTFFIGRDGLVKGVHAGFAGKASGEFYTSQGEEVSGLIESLIAADTRTAR